jgi:hypothetical protein
MYNPDWRITQLMGVGSIHGKGSDPQQTAGRGSVLSGHPRTGQSPVGQATGLKAKISVPIGSLVCGQPVSISAKHSTGFIREYHWSFEYADPSNNDTEVIAAQAVPDLKPFTKTGPEIRLVVLRSLNVVLTVIDSENRSDVAHARIDVKRRHWETKFKSDPRMKRMAGPFQAGWRSFGFNSCTKEGKSGSGHILHKTRPDSLGDDDHDPVYGYEDKQAGFYVETVDDPGGPFHGFTYVGSYNVFIDRSLFINEKFLPGGEVYNANKDSKEHARSLDKLVQSISVHEQIHSDLISENLKKNDPASTLEKFILDDGNQLRLIANLACDNADAVLQSSTPDSEVHKRMRAKGFGISGAILDSDGSEYPIPSFADLGDESRD